jgi:large subunit ribosomal protein L6|tara:strand:+ start:359 stop:898 length:540 start_codon:yes stop_codon:yes gene_type:complete
MSKIGKINIAIPEKVKIVLNGNLLNVEGPLGKQVLKIDTNIFDLKIDEGKSVSIKPKNINQDIKRLWGMNRSLLNNAIIGTSKGYSKTLELSGVGYRASLKGKQLSMQLGFSHDVNFDIPDGIKILVEKQTIIKISGSDKQEVGMITSKIKSYRPPEPYKGKGIKEQGQYVLRKEGKKK